MKDKSLNGKSSSKFHNNNFKAGYMPVENMKPEIRGRKTFAFWTLLVLLFLLVLGNLALTITIIGVLKLGQGKCFLFMLIHLFSTFTHSKYVIKYIC